MKGVTFSQSKDELISVEMEENHLNSGDNSVFLSGGAGQEPGPVWVTNDGPWTVMVTPLQMT